MADDGIDKLLERYLYLLHNYTTLRTELGTLQAGVFQNIARANYSAERGMRYGQDHFDERMKASRRTVISVNGQDLPEYSVVKDLGSDSADEVPMKSEVGRALGTDDTSETEENERTAAKKQPEKDPLQWFGLLTPMSLRLAQTQSVKAVVQIIPKLVSVNAEMAQIEIEVRRARKKRAKAVTATATKQQETVPREETMV